MFNKKDQKISLHTGTGSSLSAGDLVITPESQVVQLGGSRWGWVWNRPHRLVIRTGTEQRILPIINLTRWVQFLLYGAALLFGLGGFLFWKQDRAREKT